jgi:hypothetical protein
MVVGAVGALLVAPALRSAGRQLDAKGLRIAANKGDVVTLREAVSLEPQSSFRWQLLCEGHLTRKAYHEASEACARSIALNPQNDWALRTAGVVALCSGDKATLESMGRQLRKTSPPVADDLDDVVRDGCPP